MKTFISLTSALFLFVLISCAKKSDTDATKVAADSNKATVDTLKKTGAADFSPDTKFAVAIADGGMTEIQLSQLALKNASSKSVKDFAKIMVKDHTGAAAELKGACDKKGIALPADLSDKSQKICDDMSKKTGTDFDKAYMDQMVSDHQGAVTAFESEAKSGNDADLKAWAGKTLPTIMHHLDMAKAIKEKMKS
jgi:putative membrane protein